MSEMPENQVPTAPAMPQGAAVAHAEGFSTRMGTMAGAAAGALFGISWGVFSKTHALTKGAIGAIIGGIAGTAISAATWHKPLRISEETSLSLATNDAPTPQFVAKLEAERAAEADTARAL